jgi:beta-1,4-mannosyl-glycoprotein beta-1,4-N-acetylglucosaminyltransferase
MKLYDCFQFFNELDLLEIRLELLHEIVDYFVIVESNKTHSNLNKDYLLEENLSSFDRYKHKIIYIKETFPEKIFEYEKRQETSKKDIIYNQIISLFEEDSENDLKLFETFARDYLQREYIKMGLTDAEDDDIILISDLDEIPHPSIVKKIKSEKLYDRCVMMDCHNFFINNLCHTNWYGTVTTSFSETKNKSLTKIRNQRVTCEKFSNAGWHLSYVGGKDRIKSKIMSYSHQEYNTTDFLQKIDEKIKDNKDLFDRKNNKYKDSNQEYFFESMKSIDLKNYTYPKKILDLIENKFPYLIKK